MADKHKPMATPVQFLSLLQETAESVATELGVRLTLRVYIVTQTDIIMNPVLQSLKSPVPG